MSCDDFARWAVSDDPAERRLASEHAATCAECAARLAGWRRLAELVVAWREEAPAPPAGLERRLADRLAEEEPAAGRRPEGLATGARLGRRARRFAPWLAAAAMALLAAGLLYRVAFAPPGPAVTSGGGLVAADALRQAEEAERLHARAIARLELAAAPLLAKADSPDLPPELAARLLADRDRLRFLDRTIAEVEGFLDQNPYHAQARTILLAAYSEKTQVLREVLSLAPGGAS